MISYRLDDLGWVNFEWMCQSLLKHSIGLSIESWGGHSDFGRDAYCDQNLELDSGITSTGPFIFQCKFVQNANASGANSRSALIKAVKSECANLKNLIAEGKIDEVSNYVFLTNAPISSLLRTELSECFSEVFKNTSVRLWNGNDICRILDNLPNVRQSFPQLLGLRDLDELIRSSLNRSLEMRSLISLKRAQEWAPSFVPTEVYHEAIQKLKKYHFIMLSGPPEVGKTTLGSMIGLQMVAEGWEFLDCRCPDDFYNLIAEKPQVFIVDDVFGTTEYRPDQALQWESELDFILRHLDEHHWFIWTSRTVPLRLAMERLNLQGHAEKFPNPSELIVDARNLDSTEKALMIYRHAKSQNLEESSKNALKLVAPSIASEYSITPERIRLFVKDWLSETVSMLESGIAKEQILNKLRNELGKPTVRMIKSFRALEVPYQLFLIAMLDASSRSSSPLFEVCESANQIFANQLEKNPELLAETLTEHFVFLVERDKYWFGNTSGNSITEVGWIHPSWRDLVIDFLSQSPRLRAIFLEKCSSNGVTLALSRGGGAEGQRKFPLLKNQTDFHLLRESVRRNIVSGRNITMILIHLKEAVKSRIEEIEKIAVESVTTFQQTWNDSCYKEEFEHNLFEVESYFDLCKELGIDIPDLELEWTWKFYRKEVFDAARLYSSISEEFLEAFKDLITLAYTCFYEYSKSHVEQGFSSKSKRLARIFIHYTQNYLKHGNSFSEELDTKESLSILNSIKELVYKLSKIEDCMGDQIYDLQESLNDSIKILEEKLEKEPKKSYYRPEEKSVAVSDWIRPPKSELDDIFSDL